MAVKEELLKKLSDCVFDMEDEEVVDAVKEYIEAGFDPEEGMLNGLVDGMKRASAMYEEGEYFVPELIVCSDAMYAGIEEFQKYLPETAGTSIGKVVIGVIEGDTHDIGKNLVKIMLEVGGFDVVDLGRDVPVAKFVDYVKENEVDIVGISSLMTTTMPGMTAVVNTDESVHTARSRSAFVPVNRARRQNEYHMLKSCVNGMASGGINAPLTQLLRYDLS